MRISSASLRFCSENSKGMDGLLEGLLRCYSIRVDGQQTSIEPISFSSASIEPGEAIRDIRDSSALGTGSPQLSTYHGKGVAQPQRTSREGSALGLGEGLEQLTTDPRDDGEEFGSHCWRRRGDGEGWGGGRGGDGLKTTFRRSRRGVLRVRPAANQRRQITPAFCANDKTDGPPQFHFFSSSLLFISSSLLYFMNCSLSFGILIRSFMNLPNQSFRIDQYQHKLSSTQLRYNPSTHQRRRPHRTHNQTFSIL